MKFFTFIIFALSILILFFVSERSEPLPTLGQAPTFALSDSQAQSFSSTQLKEKVWVASFFFTSCPHVCPAINGKISKLHQEFKDKDDFEIVSITIDPEKDSSDVLKKYSTRFNADTSQWHFLTGKTEVIKDLMHNGFTLGSGKLPAEHTTRVVLVDKNGAIRGFYKGLEQEAMQKISQDIKKLL